MNALTFANYHKGNRTQLSLKKGTPLAPTDPKSTRPQIEPASTI
jgi:hypothetical protein